MRPEAARHQGHLNLGPRSLVSVTSLNKRAGLSGFPPCGLLLAFFKEAGHGSSREHRAVGCGRAPTLPGSLCRLQCQVLFGASHCGDFVGLFPMIVC